MNLIHVKHYRIRHILNVMDQSTSTLCDHDSDKVTYAFTLTTRHITRMKDNQMTMELPLSLTNKNVLRQKTNIINSWKKYNSAEQS